MVGVVAGIVAAGLVCAQPPEQPHRARARLVSERASLEPGKTAWLGLAFDIDKDWHLYWNGRNDTGVPISFEPTFPEGYKAGEALWPAPRRHASEDFLDHVYEERVTILIPVQVPAGAKPGETATFKLHAKWLVCKTVCLMEESDLTLTLPVVGDASTEGPTAIDRLFSQARARIPKPLDAAKPEVTISWDGDRVRIRSTGPAKGVAFYPAEDCVELTDLRVQGESKTDTLDLHAGKPAGRLVGVVEIEPQENGRHIVYAIDAAIPAAGDSEGKLERK